MKSETVSLSRREYEDMLDYMERMRETIDVLSSKETVKKLKAAIKRMGAGEYLTREDMLDV